jgi:transposase
MQAVTTVGLDIAKSVFQVHGIDREGHVIIRRQLRRRYVLAFFEKLAPCLVGIEACAAAHYWSRELRALGHSVRLMPPAYVRPYVKRQKNMLPTLRRSAKPSPGPTCGSFQPRQPSSRAA